MRKLGACLRLDSVFRPWQSEKMIGSVIPENLKNKWNLVLGKSNEKLEKLFEDVSDVEIFIHDSLHTYKNMMFEFETALQKIRNNGIIISDDVLENDAFHDFSKNKNLESVLIKVKENVF